MPDDRGDGGEGVDRGSRDARVTLASKEGETGGEVEGGGGEGKDVTIAGRTNERTNKER